jgi:hypothetical protein
MELSYLYVVSTIFVAMLIVFALSIVVQYVSKLKSFVLNSMGNKASVNKLEIVEKNEEYKKGNGSLDDLEVVAVIAAAISSYLDIPQSSLNIKSIKRVDSNRE